MRIGEVAKQAGISRDAIRFYEGQGLIRSNIPPGSTSGYRAYTAETLPTLQVIKDAQAAGLSLADITVIMGRGARDAPRDFDVEAFLNLKVTEVVERLEGAARFLTMLQQTRQAYENARISKWEERGAGNENRTRN